MAGTSRMTKFSLLLNMGVYIPPDSLVLLVGSPNLYHWLLDVLNLYRSVFVNETPVGIYN